MNSSIYVNHMAAPALSVSDFLALCSSISFKGVELRNDIGKGDPLQGLSGDEVRQMLRDFRLEAFTINALQHCNVRSKIEDLKQDLQNIAKTARDAGIPAIVFCPENAHDDHRGRQESLDDLRFTMKKLSPTLKEYDLLGFVEPLGFPQSSLRSQKDALETITVVGSDRYRLLLDTFHFALGPDSIDDLRRYPRDLIGLVHVSSVTTDRALAELTNEDRVLPCREDLLDTEQQIRTLSAAGFAGPYAFEPFASKYAIMNSQILKDALRASIDYFNDLIS